MDRLEGANARWSRWLLFTVGLTLAMVMNVSTVRIVTDLWNDTTLRSVVADASVDLVKKGECPPSTTSTSIPAGEEGASASACTPGDKLEYAVANIDDLKIPVG